MKVQIIELGMGVILRRALSITILGLLPTLTVPVAAGARPFAIERVAPGVHVAIRPDPLAHPVEGNVTFLVGSSDVIVVDTSRTPASAREVIAGIRRVTPLPVRYIINTHWHGDHHHGNAAYAEAYPGVTIVSHRATREDITTLGRQSLEGQIRSFSNRPTLEAALESGMLNDQPLTPSIEHRISQLLSVPEDHLAELESVQLTPPTLTFERELRLHQDEREIRVFSRGAGNTRGDAVVHLPRERIVLTGDLLVATIPFMSMSYPHGWLERLDEIAALDFELIVPGHGPLQRDRTLLERHRALLSSAVAQIDGFVARGASLEETLAGFDLDSFRDAYAEGDPFLALEFDYRVGSTTPRHAYLEATSARAETLAESVRQEAARWTAVLAGVSEPPPAVADGLSTAAEALGRIPSHLAAGRTYHALEELARHQGTAGYGTFLVEHADAVSDLETFEALWTEMGLELSRTAGSVGPGSEPPSAAVRARTEIATHHILTHYHASRLYAKAGEGLGGVAYLGTAWAAAERARFLSTVNDPPAGAGPRLDRLDAIERELSRLTLDAYGHGDAALAEHPTFIALDAQLKQSRELIDDDRRHGAAASLLEARMLLGLLSARSPAQPDPSSVGYHGRLYDPSRDHSLARTLWERALVHAGSSDAEDRRRAAVILSEVIPFYFANLID